MASVFKRESPYYYAKIRDPRSLKWKKVKTPFKIDDPAGKRNALIWADSKDRVGKEGRTLVLAEGWSRWVEPWLKTTFSYNAKTLKRYQNAWTHLNEFVAEHSIPVPREWKYKHSDLYIAWRRAQKRRRGTFINKNTAITELKVLSRIMREAQSREYCDSNPIYKLGLKRENVRHAPAMSDEDCVRIKQCLVEYVAEKPLVRGWMTPCFEIARYHGVRLSETQTPMEWVHLDSRTRPPSDQLPQGANFDRITFTCKGRSGVAKIHAVPLHPNLREMMAALKRSGSKVTCEVPRMGSKYWWSFRQRYGFKHLTFHSTRATVATKLAQAGVPLQQAMEYLAHGSETVHLAYLRFDAKDVAGAALAVSYATPSTPGSQGEQPPTPPAPALSNRGRRGTGRQGLLATGV